MIDLSEKIHLVNEIETKMHESARTEAYDDASKELARRQVDLANALMENGHGQESELMLFRASVNWPYARVPWYRISLCASRDQRWADLLRCIRKCLPLEPDGPTAYPSSDPVMSVPDAWDYHPWVLYFIALSQNGMDAEADAVMSKMTADWPDAPLVKETRQVWSDLKEEAKYPEDPKENA